MPQQMARHMRQLSGDARAGHGRIWYSQSIFAAADGEAHRSATTVTPERGRGVSKPSATAAMQQQMAGTSLQRHAAADGEEHRGCYNGAWHPPTASTTGNDRNNLAHTICEDSASTHTPGAEGTQSRTTRATHDFPTGPHRPAAHSTVHVAACQDIPVQCGAGPEPRDGAGPHACAMPQAPRGVDWGMDALGARVEDGHNAPTSRADVADLVLETQSLQYQGTCIHGLFVYATWYTA
ncbi:hypothetical protein CYMTET_32208 [Cymbomonas tetramitiformis]|uniref:Uncharacterized protein n=1 Tax=Cymbomonas tetramitiformis TaxID=36881 RepID=A0AAE0FFH3_9CHLO|nr:hypothetical protein CYMTET_32208 [Cymbomonas tetramitiformis]